jgi:hypothetical protein
VWQIHNPMCNRVKFREKQCCSGCVITSPADKKSDKVHFVNGRDHRDKVAIKTICAHDYIEKVLSISVEARLAIDIMFKIVKIIRPKNILSNLEEINRSYERENAKIREGPKRQHETEKALIVIPLLHHYEL